MCASQVKLEFMTMLAEGQHSITDQSQWRKVKGSFDHDPRYKAVESSSKREEFFVEFQKSLKDKDQVLAQEVYCGFGLSCKKFFCTCAIDLEWEKSRMHKI